jgi:hypothetical protein
MKVPTREPLAAGKMENCFRDASDLIEQYLIDGAAGMSGAAPIAIFHLICRSLADLRCAQYLASSGFTIQMYSLVRPAIESINLVDLFAAEPAAADDWIAGKHWEFRPAKVRERLGLGDDEGLLMGGCALASALPWPSTDDLPREEREHRRRDGAAVHWRPTARASFGPDGDDAARKRSLHVVVGARTRHRQGRGSPNVADSCAKGRRA